MVDLNRAKEDIIYFANNILKIKLNKYQEEIIKSNKKIRIRR